MAVTPQYEQRTSPGGPLGPGPQDRGEDALVRGARSIQRNVAQVEEFKRDQEESAALVSANEDLQSARSSWSATLADRKQKAPAGAAGFTQGFLKDFDADAKERVARAKTSHAKDQLRARLADVRQSLQEDSQAFELGSATRQRVDQLDNSIQSARTGVNFRPQDYDKIVAETMTAIGGSGLSDEQRLEAMENAGQSLAGAAVQGMIHENPYRTLRELNNEKADSNAIQALNLDTRQHLRSMAQSEINRIESEQRANKQEAVNLLRTDTADAFAARALGLPAVLPERKRYVAAYGNEGPARHASDQARWKIYDVAGEAAYQAPQEAAKTLEKLKPVTQTGAAEGTENYVAAVQLYGRQRKALEDNPVETLEARDPQLVDAHTAAAKDPTQIPAYFSMLRARQQALGIAEPKLLPEAKRTEIAAELVFDIDKPRQRTEVLQRLRASYGDEYANVMQEVAPKLDGMSRVLIGMDVKDAQRLDAAYAQKDALTKAVPSKATTDIEESVRASLTEFAATLADNPDGPSRYAEHFDAARLYAQSMVANGASPEAAADAAAKAVINSQYTYRDGVRIPATLDDDRMARGMAEQKRLLAKDGQFVIQQLKFSTPGQAQADMRNLIERQGYWITNERGTGVVLRIPHREGQGEVYWAGPSKDPAGFPIDTSRPRIENSDGSFSTERTITVGFDQRFYNIPTIWDGKQLTPEAAIDRAKKALDKGEVFPNFASSQEAERAAVARSNTIESARSGKRVEFTWEELENTKLAPAPIENLPY